MRAAQTSEEILPGSTLRFTLSRKAIRRAYLRVRREDGRVCISAPHGLSLAQIHAFIRQHQDWIARQQTQQRQPPPAEADFSRLWLWGEAWDVHWQHGGQRATVHAEGHTLHCRLPEGKATPEQCQALLDRVLRQALARAIEHRLPHWCSVTGHALPAVRIRRMSSRWGSCQILRRRLSINLALAHYPPACLDLVLVHELIHFDERQHNARFYQKMDACLPGWRAWDRVLRAPPGAGVHSPDDEGAGKSTSS
ncbi:M48 family metallopeptidase [Halothiobacillus sp. DCM-1]|uniref:M48 family metallopeptidase n=1 Tax=Halothiobacillus sp. DCM-1 TaxID=3112558 RepID=UPI0032473FA4